MATAKKKGTKKRKRTSARRRTGKAEQELFSFARSRRARRGKKLGRPKEPGAGVSHARRERVSDREPQHVTVRLVEGLPSLRSGRVLDVLRRVFGEARERLGMRICHWSVQTNHIHLIVEAEDAEALSRGMTGLLTRISRRVNTLWRRTGRFFADRFHAVALTCPRQVWNTIAYVLKNTAHHGRRAGPLDIFSTAPYFDGWPEPIELVNEPPGPRPLAPPGTWLLREGWRRHGTIPFTS